MFKVLFSKCRQLLQSFNAGPLSCQSFWKTAIMKSHLIFRNRRFKLKSLQQPQIIIVACLKSSSPLKSGVFFMCFTYWIHTHTHTQPPPTPSLWCNYDSQDKSKPQGKHTVLSCTVHHCRDAEEEEPRGATERWKSGFWLQKEERADQPLAVFSQLAVLSRPLQRHRIVCPLFSWTIISIHHLMQTIFPFLYPKFIRISYLYQKVGILAEACRVLAVFWLYFIFYWRLIVRKRMNCW